MIYAHVVVVRNIKTVTVKTTNESMRFGEFQAAFALFKDSKRALFLKRGDWLANPFNEAQNAIMAM